MEKFTPEKEIASRQGEVSHEQVTEKATEALKELELRELQKSEQPINQEGNSKRTIQTIRPWNNYTIVTLEGSDKIQIFNEDAKPLEDFKPPLSSKSAYVDWTNYYVKGKIGKECIGQDDSDIWVLKISQVPLQFRAFAKRDLGTSQIFYLNLKGRST